MIKIEKYEKFFEEYTERYLSQTKNNSERLHMSRKKYHSIRVKDFALEIAKTLDFTEYELQIMLITALFHDIGRFKQFKLYNTYVDSISENHAILGVKILKEEKILSELFEDDKKIILKSIELHNLKDLPNDLDKNLYKYVTVLRDADKIDWLYACANIIPGIPKNEQRVFFCDNDIEYGIRKEIVDKVLNCSVIDKRILQTQDEVRAFGFGYITSSLVYKKSLEIIKEQNIIDKIYDQMEKNDESKKIYEFVKEKIY